MKWLSGIAALTCLIVVGADGAMAQDMPAEYQAVLKTLGKTGDFGSSVLKVNIPRSDLRVTIGGCLLYTSPSPRDRTRSRMPSSA